MQFISERTLFMDNISKTIDPKIRLIVTILLLFSGFVSLASQTMMITALPVIEHEMNVSLTLVQWLTTGYTLMIGVITPLSSNLYEKFKKRNIFLATIAIFILATLIGCFATDFWQEISPIVKYKKYSKRLSE